MVRFYDDDGNYTTDDDFNIRNRVLIPVPGYDLFIGNEAWSASDGWAEGSLLLVERLLTWRWAFDKPAWVSDAYWNGVITPSLPPLQQCFIPTDCPVDTVCATYQCNLGHCNMTPNTGDTCDDQNPCTTNDKCTSNGICAGTPIQCQGNYICVNGNCVPPTPPPLPTCTFSNTIGNFQLYWNWIGNDSIRIAFSLPSVAFVGLGINASIMANADIVIGYANNDATFGINDYFAFTEATPSTDTSLGGFNNLMNTWVSRINGITTVWFTRLLITGDQYDNIIIPNSTMNFIYAWGSSTTPGQLAYHGPTQRSSVSVNMAAC